MKVLYDHAIFARQPHGGISRYFAELIARAARGEALDALVFMGLYVNEYGLENHRRDFARFFGVRRFVRRNTYQLTRQLNRFLFERFAKRNPADVFHQTAYLNLPAGNAKRVITLHDCIDEIYGQNANNDLFAGKRQAIEQADGIICISQRTREDLHRFYGTPRGRVTVIYHANSLSAAPAGPPLVNQPYVLYVGSRGGYKNFKCVLDAYAASPTLRRAVKLVCFGGGVFSPEETQTIKQLALGDRVQQLGGGDDRLASLYASAVAFVYPSLYEGFGIPLLEAMRLGCPVLASDASCFPEIAGDAAAYFDPQSPDACRHELERLVADPAQRARLRVLGHAREAQFNWDRCVGETVAFYREVAAG